MSNVKCWYCKKSTQTKEEMKLDPRYKTKRYIHEECWDEYYEKTHKNFMKKCVHCNKKTIDKYSHEEGKDYHSVDGKLVHDYCLEEYEKNKAIIEKDKKDLDELVDYLCKFLNVKILPTNTYTMLASIRNGDNGVLGGRAKNKKKGYGYDIILETFKTYADTMNYYLRTKNFDSVSNALRYMLAIVLNKIPMVEKRVLASRETKEEVKNETEEEIAKKMSNFKEIKRNKPKKKRPTYFDD